MSRSRPNVRSTYRRSESAAGVSLAEVLVALTLVTTLFLAALSMMTVDQKVYTKDDAVLEATAEGRHALGVLERDILMAGYQVDVRTIADVGPDGTANTDDDTIGQEKIVLAAPWELVFNADIEPGIDALRDGLGNDSLPSGYAPVTFFTGAETIRFTLDSDSSGTLTAADLGDEADELAVGNPNLYMLQREVYGYDGANNVVQGGGIALIRGPAAYPSGAVPPPLFQYWGYFDSDAALDLWGDDGSGGGTAGNGVLETGEIAALAAVTDEDTDDDGVLDTGEDRNANGTLEARVTDLIVGIEIRVITETSGPDPDWQNPDVSTALSPYRFRILAAGTRVEPRNMDLPGGACGDDPEPTGGASVVNACAHPLADGRVDVSWTLSADDGGFETDVDRYLLFKTTADNLFSPTPLTEVPSGTTGWTDGFSDARTWPPVQSWYRVRALDCTPALSIGDPVAGPYPAARGPMFPQSLAVQDVAGDDGTSLRVSWTPSPDDPANTTGYGADVSEYHVYRSDQSDYRCVEPVNNDPVAASGAPLYSYLDNAADSTAAPVFGELYYYWSRARDATPTLSPYSARACGRAYRGPAMPLQPQARVVTYTASDHPAEIWFSENPLNPAAGYDPAKILYKVYRSHDVNGDGIGDTLVDDPIGYTTADLAGSVSMTGLAWAVGDAASCARATVDGGASWRNPNGIAANQLNAIEFRDRLNGLAVGDLGSIERTADGGANFAQVTSGSISELRDVGWIDDSHVVAVGEIGTVLYSTNGGAGWQAATTPVAVRLTGVDAVPGIAVAVGDANTVIYSIDGGANWQLSPTVPPDDLSDVCVIGSPANPTVLAGGTAGRVWMNQNSTDPWTPVALPGGVLDDIGGLDCSDDGVALVYLRSSSTLQVYRSADSGLNWGLETLPGSGELSDVGLVDNEIAYATSLDGGIFRRDATGGWSQVNIDGSCSYAAVAVRPEIVWQDSSSSAHPSGRAYYYVITAAYDEFDPILDGESGLLPDRSGTFESPNDSLDQVLVDSCNNFEVSTSQP